jgi:SNF2-related domain/SNF2 Helicase protein/Helicase conserved C-terminal domain
MLVIHATWAYGVLSLWAEDSDGSAPAQPGPGYPGRPARPSRAPRPHPFAADPDRLADAVAELAGPWADLARKAIDDELTLRLPSVADGPQASPELVRVPSAPPAAKPARAAPTRAARPVLAAWRVPALTFDPAVAADLLTALGEPGAGAASAVAGASVLYVAALARLAGDLAARGRVLPVLAAGQDGRYAARWRPVLAGADAQRARELAAAMPPLCRADAGSETSASLVTDALDALADAAARARLAREPGFELLPARPARPARAARPAPSRRAGRVAVAERWVAALTGADAQVLVDTAEAEVEAAELAAALDGWRAAAQAPAGPVRTCFRLVEPQAAFWAEQAEPGAGQGNAPEGGDGPESSAAWTVELALQSTDDPSLLLPAANIWSGESADGWAAAGIRHPEEELLAGLGAASRLFAELDEELRMPAPEAVSLDTEGAARFLQQTGPLLAGAGFGVLLPDWVGGARKRLGIKMTARTRSTGSGAAPAAESRFGLNDMVDFRYDLAIGDDSLDPEELEELARLKVPLVRLRGQWVELDDRHLKAALKFLERSRERTGTMTAAEALADGLGGVDDELPVVGVDADGWLGDLLSGQADRRLAPVATPASFRGELRPYQERGLAWLSFLGDLGLGAVLADDMGLGKGPQTLALLARNSAAEPGHTLLVCPMSLVGHWQREAAKFTPGLRVHVHHGADRLKGEELASALGAADLVITTYALAARDQDALSEVQWARVVCDEAQNIKNAATRQARAVRALPASSRIALTGTPVENRLADLWSIMEFARPGILGPAERFRTKFAVPIERNGDEEAAARLRRITGPFILRRLKTDKTIISDLPDKLEMKVWCNLTPEQASLYQATVSDMMARIEASEAEGDGIGRRGLVLATMAKLKQVCNHPAHLLGDGSRLAGRSGKLQRLEEICDEVIADGDKALCFTQYAEFGGMLQPYLTSRLGCPVLYLHGGTPKRQRDAMVAEFQASAEPALFVLSLKAGGTGLNLTAANHVIHVDRWWNPAVEEQATDRAFRIGQRKDVQVRKFVCVGTLEERIDSMIEEKKALAERIVGTGESWLTELSTSDLREVIALSPEAVSE